MKLLRKIIRNVEDYGMLISLKKSLSYPLKPFYENRVYRIYKIELENTEVRKVDRKDFTFKIVNSKDSIIIKQIESMEEWLHGKLGTGLEKQKMCLVALDKEKVAGFNLISFGEVFIPLLKYNKIFASDEAWSEQITVHKNYRRKGLATDLRRRIFLELKKKGIKKLYGGSLKRNKIALRLARKVGFENLIDMHFIKFCWYKKHRCKELNK